MKDPKITLPIILSEKENQKYNLIETKKENFCRYFSSLLNSVVFFFTTNRLTFMTAGMLHDG